MNPAGSHRLTMASLACCFLLWQLEALIGPTDLSHRFVCVWGRESWVRFQHRPVRDTRAMSVNRRCLLRWYRRRTALHRDVPTPGLGWHRGDEAVRRWMHTRLLVSQWPVLLCLMSSPCIFRILQMLLGSVIWAAASRLGQLEGVAPNSDVHPWQKKELI